MAAQADPLLGKFYRLELSTDSGTTWNKVALISDLNADESIDEREIAHRDNCGEKDYIPGDYNGSTSFTAYVNHAAESGFLKTNDIKAMFYGKVTFDFRIRPVDCEGTAMVDEYEIEGATGFFTSCNTSYPTSEEATIDLTLRYKGAPDYTVVT